MRHAVGVGDRPVASRRLRRYRRPEPARKPGRLAVGPSHATTARASRQRAQSRSVRRPIGWVAGMGQHRSHADGRRALYASVAMPASPCYRPQRRRGPLAGAPFASARCPSGMADAPNRGSMLPFDPKAMPAGHRRAQRMGRGRYWSAMSDDVRGDGAGPAAGDRRAPPGPAPPDRRPRSRVVPSRRDRLPRRGPPARGGAARPRRPRSPSSSGCAPSTTSRSCRAAPGPDCRAARPASRARSPSPSRA